MLHPAYIAGLIDGEGSLGIYQRQGAMARNSREAGYFQPVISVGITDRALPDMLQARFGGRVYTPGGRRATWKPVYIWDVTGGRVIPVLDVIEPYAVIKAPQVALMRRFVTQRLASGRRGAYSEDDLAVFLECVAASTRLNRRGIAPT